MLPPPEIPLLDAGLEEDTGLDEDELLSGVLLDMGFEEEEDGAVVDDEGDSVEELAVGFLLDVLSAEETSLEPVEGLPLTEEVSAGFSCFEETSVVGLESTSFSSLGFDEVSGASVKSEDAPFVTDESGLPSLSTTSPFLHALRQIKRLKAIKQMNIFFICGLLSSLCNSIIPYHRANLLRKLDKNMQNFYPLNKGCIYFKLIFVEFQQLFFLINEKIQNLLQRTAFIFV
jgi:hypothetical protein